MKKFDEMAELLFKDVTKTKDDLLKMYPKRDCFVTRFAPSPTGFLHIGGVYTALINRKMATQNDGIFILRLEDTDKKREVKGSKETIINIFNRFNIKIDEGITNHGEIGEYGPYVQSNRASIYHILAKFLVQEGMAYPCFCTEEELNKIREDQIKNKITPGYYKNFAKYRDISYDEAKKLIDSNHPYVIRFRVKDDVKPRVVIDDLIKGHIEMENNQNDFVLLKEDGLPTYHFAHACDDYLMGTSVVIRSDEWVASIPIHMQLFDALNFQLPKYAHVAPIMKQDGNSRRKLSKRYDPESNAEFYIKMGYPTKAIYVYLYTLINSNFEEWYLNNPSTPLDDFKFTYESMGVSGGLYDLDKLNSISSEIIYNYTPLENLNNTIAWAKEFDEKTYNLITNDQNFALRLFKTQGQNSSEHRKDLACYSDFLNFFGIYYDQVFNSHDNSYISKILENVNNDDFEYVFNNLITYFKEVKEGSSRTLKDLSIFLNYTNPKKYNNNKELYRGIVFQFYKTIRLSLTHLESGISIDDIISCLGYDKVIERLSKTLEEYKLQK